MKKEDERMDCYYIEASDEFFRDIALHQKWNIKMLQFKTLYTGFQTAAEISIPYEDYPEFMKQVYFWKEKCSIRIYKKEKNYYRPMMIKNENTPYLYTTFAYKMLERPEAFIKPKSDVVDANFLEAFEIEQVNSDMVRCIYQSAMHIPSGTITDGTDTGVLEILNAEQNQVQQVHSKIDNIRFLLEKEAKSPYDELFGFPNKNGRTVKEMTEYYIPYTDTSVIHYADEVDMIEIYQKDGNMSLEPSHVFQKNTRSKKLIEQDVLKAIENYKKEELGTSRIRVFDNK